MWGVLNGFKNFVPLLFFKKHASSKILNQWLKWLYIAYFAQLGSFLKFDPYLSITLSKLPENAIDSSKFHFLVNQ